MDGVFMMQIGMVLLLHLQSTFCVLVATLANARRCQQMLAVTVHCAILAGDD